jgi:NitT/TauT family transport system ATP-binding protein
VSDIAFDGVSRVFHRDGQSFPALEGISLEVRDREFVAIVGPSGCGKTTCLRMAAGLEFPTSGTVSVGGKPVTRPGPDRAVVFQQFALFPWKTVRENIDFGLRSKDLPEPARRERITRQVELMGLQGYESAYPHQLSGGMQQRVAIARALAYQPRVLLMDEPFAAVDAQTRADLEDLVRSVWKHFGVTLLFVTHDIDEAVYLGQRVVVLSNSPTVVAEDLTIDLPADRDQLTTRADPRFLELRGHIYSLIQQAKRAVSRVSQQGGNHEHAVG